MGAKTQFLVNAHNYQAYFSWILTHLATALMLGICSLEALAADADSDGIPDTASWVQLGSDIDGEAADDYSGGSVALSANGNIMAIGAYGNDSASGTDTRHGHARILSWEQIGSGSCLEPLTDSENYEWCQIGQDIDGEAAGDYSGWSVALSADGNVVAIGARYNVGVNGANSGHVRLYKWNGTAWV